MRAMARVPLPPAETMTLTVLAEIASGGMGSVEMARVESGPHAGEVLGIKRLHASIANDKTFVDMFLDEAWLTAAMRSPHVMGVVAHGTDDRGMFLAVELIEGVPLSRLLKEARVKKEIFSEQVVACIAMQICEGLTEAHGLKGTDGKPLGLVHRDLTPGNVLVAFDGNVKIVDFGIAKAEERITHTRTGTMKGKPAYMAPEQAKGGKNMDLRADLFSLGVMMFELLASRRPWVEKSAFDVIMSAALKPHPNLAELRPGVSSVFLEVIDKCLAKKAAERWGSAAEIRDRLIAWRRTQNFPKPDLEVLRDFVVRNSQAQIEWFRRARQGEFIKGQAQTFKELEEAIDDARKRSGEAPLSMVPSMAPVSSGRSAFDSMTPSKAKLILVDEGGPGSGPTPPPTTPLPPTPPAGSARQPTPGTEPTPLSPGQRAGGTMQSLTEASRQAQSRLSAAPSSTTQPLPATSPLPSLQATTRGSGPSLSGTIALSEADLQIESAPRSGQFGPQSGLRKGGSDSKGLAATENRGPAVPENRGPGVPENRGLGSTEYMEVSPLKGMRLSEPRIEHAPDVDESDLSATVRMPELADRPVRDADGSSRSVVRPLGGLLAEDDLALGATLRSDETGAPPVPVRQILKQISERPPPPAEAPKQDTGRPTGWNLRNQAQPPPPPEAKGLSGTTVLLLILVAFIAGGAIAAYVAKTYLIKPAGELGPSPVASRETGASGKRQEDGPPRGRPLAILRGESARGAHLAVRHRA